MQWVLVTDANFDAPLNLWKLAYTETIFIAFLVIFAKKLYHRIKQHSLLSDKYYFMHITSPNATRLELTIVEGFSNGWTKKLTLLTLFTASIYKSCGGVSSDKNKGTKRFNFLTKRFNILTFMVNGHKRFIDIACNLVIKCLRKKKLKRKALDRVKKT